MNKHIELVKKWLADNDSVTQQELDDNRTTAAADADNADNADNAEYWIKRYEELKEQE